MDLGLRGQSVLSADSGYTVSLNFSGGYEIRIETCFSLHDSAGDFQLVPGVEPDTTARRLHALTGHPVTTSVADSSGTLHVDFASGARLRVEPDDSFEAWTLAGPDGMKVACLPGGELAVWSAATDEAAPHDPAG